MKHHPWAYHWRMDQVDLRQHDVRMSVGCLGCGSAVPGRVCPDCYTCIACQPGCDECAELRPSNTRATPCIPPPKKPPRRPQ